MQRLSEEDLDDDDEQVLKKLKKILNPDEPYFCEMKLNEVQESEESTVYQKNIDEKKALLAFWEYKVETKEFDCIESFEIM